MTQGQTFERSAPAEGPVPGLDPTLPRDAYLSERHFERERQAIFLTEWMCVARDERLPEPGDYVEVEVAGESVLLVRDRDGTFRGHYNVCRHRGCTLVPPGDRRATGPHGHLGGGIRCPYHSWTYGLDGTLRKAPFLDDLEAHRHHLSLHAVEVDTWGGFVFVRLASGERSLREQLGPVRERLHRYALEDLRTGERLVYEVEANWKVIAENYNECYHCGPVHPELCRIVPAFRDGGGASLDWDAGIPHRDGTYTFTATGTTARASLPGLSEEERVRHKGELVYPNLLLSLSADHVAAFTLWPEGPGRTTVVCDFLFHPDEMARESFDPSDAVEFWDLINRQDWEVCEGVQRGMGSRMWSGGYYAPMEDTSADIRRYVQDRLGEAP
jgi:glycine betaine catabolism A